MARGPMDDEIDPAADGGPPTGAPDDAVDPASVAVVLHAGPPAWVLAAVLPLGAIGLIWFRTSQSGLSAGPDDPVPPIVVAGLTLVAALVLAWRALTQRAVLDGSGLRSRNLTVTYRLEWEKVERLDVVERPGLQIIEVRMRGMRRRHRIGAATRFSGDEAHTVLDALRAHHIARELVRDPDW
ncbi:MAG: hypothetical protein ACYC2O_12530 [Microthrixaceae bacterium]